MVTVRKFHLAFSLTALPSESLDLGM